MQFHSVSEFLAMGGYAFYVWLAYGVSLVVLVWLGVSGPLRRRQLLAEERRRQRREAATPREQPEPFPRAAQGDRSPGGSDSADSSQVVSSSHVGSNS